MHPHLHDVLTRLDESRTALLAAVNAIPTADRTRRPAPGRWSAAEILEHLALVESRFAGMLRTRIDEALAAGLGPESGARVPLPDAIAERMRDRVNKRTAPETAVPSGTLDEPAARAAAEQARRELRDAIQRADGRALGTVRHSHPTFGDLDVYQYVELIAAHEARHASQAGELRVFFGAGTDAASAATQAI